MQKYIMANANLLPLKNNMTLTPRLQLIRGSVFGRGENSWDEGRKKGREPKET